jgi:LPS-assembly lipoprotein
MSRRAALGVLAAALLGLAGCGEVRPLYGSAGAAGYTAAGDLAAIRFAPISDRVGQRLRNELIRLVTPSGEPGNPDYQMSLQLEVGESDVLVRTTSEVDRKTLTLAVSYRIVEVGTDNEVVTGKAFADASYNRVASEFANIRAREDAENRAANIVAEQIRTQIAARLRA